LSNRKKKKLKVCLAASAGGHMSQLLKLNQCWKDHDRVFVTTGNMVSKSLDDKSKVYVVGESNRQHPFKVLNVFWRCIKIIVREKPDVVISTGASAGCICCWLAKIRGAKIVWIDSITNVQRLSLSGKLVYKIADLLIVQWPELAEEYKNARYLGTLI
jgi:UDP-N-acetylglucosamine:LPS N-acetylglucosamine transferase